MTSLPRSPLADPDVRRALAADLDLESSPAAARLADLLASAFGPSTVALLHYGSHAHQSDARPESAHDYFVIVDDYASAYRALARAVGTSYRPRLAAALNRVLPPNVIAVTERSATPPLHAKLAVLSLDDFRRACSARARDHFVRGRLFQSAALAWWRDDSSRDAVTDAVLAARAGSFRWGRSFLPYRFDVDAYCRTLLAASFAAEIRPERRDRVDALLAAQRTRIVPMYSALLRWLEHAGMLATDGATYTMRQPASWKERLHAVVYFRRSKLRATLRWVKYVALYDDWLDYVVQKVARRSGVTITLTPRERRWPLIFLWPKAIRFLRMRPQRRG
jgi:hypothetical protein